MAYSFVEAFVDKLMLLEDKVGSMVHYKIMSPVDVNLYDQIIVQKVSKQIAGFIGFDDYTFIIASAQQKDSVAGHIDLSKSGKEVFIEVDSDLKEIPSSFMATLCHEICHKWLQIKGISSNIERDNEYLTDITSVFLGFGKIMLNGCEAIHTKHENVSESVKSITRYIKTGYLDIDQLAFVYKLVCSMRNIPSSLYMSGLNNPATLAVKKSEMKYGKYFDSLSNKEEEKQKTIKIVEDQILQAQKIMANLYKHTMYIEKSFCDVIKQSLDKGHNSLVRTVDMITNNNESSNFNQAMIFLKSIQSNIKLKSFITQTSEIIKKMNGLFGHALTLSRHIDQNKYLFPSLPSEFFTISKCPKDQTTLRLPANSGEIIATCPECKYRFAYNTNPITFPKLDKPKKLNWMNRIKKNLKLKF